VVALLVTLAGCSAAVSDPPAIPSATGTPVGLCLNRLGLEHGLAELICLPADTTLETTYEAERTILLLGPADQGQAVLDYLAANLPDLGWSVVRGDGGLRFDQGEWQGSFVIGQTWWGLTVRAE
jgi:hypothetical protein